MSCKSSVQQKQQRWHGSTKKLKEKISKRNSADVGEAPADKLKDAKTDEKPTESRRLYGELGTPHNVSRVRPICLHPVENESEAERWFREERMAIQQAHHTFWVNNNEKFICGKTRFENEKRVANGGEPITADEFAEFYTKFLKDNERDHREYNKWWWRKNISMLIPALKANAQYYKRTLLSK
eukprot:CFRG2289T1